MSNVIESIERAQLRKVPRFKAGDTVRVHFQVIEGQRRRVQVYEGIVLKRQGSGARETFTVRKQSFGVGVERSFPLHSPKIEKIEVTAVGDVNRAKLYYLRRQGRGGPRLARGTARRRRRAARLCVPEGASRATADVSQRLETMHRGAARSPLSRGARLCGEGRRARDPARRHRPQRAPQVES